MPVRLLIIFVLARFSLYVSVDNSIVHYVQSLTDMISGAIVRFGVILIMSPIFGVPGALMCVIGVWIGQLYMKAQLAVKRERSNARSPILGHIGAAISGLGMSLISNQWDIYQFSTLRSIHSSIWSPRCIQTRIVPAHRPLY